MSIKIVPTFFLKGVDPKSFISRYEKGEFSGEDYMKRGKIPLTNHQIFSKVFSNNQEDGVYAIKNRNNYDIVFATTGHSDYVNFDGEISKGGRCRWCCSDFTGTRCGIPVAHKELLMVKEVDGEERYFILDAFWLEGRFCSDECTLGYLSLSRQSSFRHSSTVTEDNERRLRKLHSLKFPEASVLQACNDPLLLKINGGSLDYDEWSINKFVYTRSDRIILLPAKVEYLRKTNNLNDIKSVVDPQNLY